MAMTSGNDGEIKVEEDTKSTDKTFTEVKKSKDPVVEVKPVEAKPVPKAPSVVPIPSNNAAIVFLAQRLLDQSGFEDFKALYPGLFE